MRALFIIPHDTRIRFVERRLIAFMVSAVLLLGSLGAYLGVGLNYGIDFQGGTLIEVKTEGPADIAGMRRTLSGLGLGDVQIQEFGAPDDVLIRLQQQEGGEGAQIEAIDTVKAALPDDVTYRRTEFVGPKVGDELIEAGVTAVLLAMGAIMLYIWFRFEWQFGIGALAALTHDVITTIGLFAVLGLEFNLSTVAAILTIAGYSINDTVVVYDRVRENLRKYKSMPLMELLNVSLNATLSRTLMTSVTTLLALGALYIFGGKVIAGFTLAMIWGVVIGTYSTMFVAVPLLLYLGVHRGGDEEEDVPAAARG